MAELQIHCGFQIIHTNSFFRHSTWVKGEALFEAKHVARVRESGHGNNGTAEVTGMCLPQTNVSKKPYNVQIKLSQARTIQAASCDCKAGIVGKCKHVAAVVIFCNKENGDSRTSKSQQWGFPKQKETYSKGVKIGDIFKPHEDEIGIKPKPVSDVLELLPDLKCPLVKILAAERINYDIQQSLEVLREIVNSVHLISENSLCKEILNNLLKTSKSTFLSYTVTSDVRTLRFKSIDYLDLIDPPLSLFYTSKVVITESRICELAIETVTQSCHSVWFKERKLRISSSNCHKIVTRQTCFETLAQNFFGKFRGNEATEYGSRLERTAKCSFAFKANLRVVDVGVVICKSNNWLCASPDGLCVDASTGSVSLLEVKCPFSRKGKLIVDYENRISFVKYLKFIDNKLELSVSHAYYCQIQICLYVLNISLCNLYVFSSTQSVHLTINRDDNYLAEKLPKLRMFYFTYLLPTLGNFGNDLDE